jgi:hypothetical protein
MAAEVVRESCGNFNDDDDDDDDGTKEDAGASTSQTSLPAPKLAELRAEQIKWIGYDLEVMKEAKRLMPRHDAYHVANSSTEDAALAVVEGAVAAALDGVDFKADPAVVTLRVVDAAKARGLRVLVWETSKVPTMDTPATWAVLEANGVEAFTSAMPPALDDWCGVPATTTGSKAGVYHPSSSPYPSTVYHA